MLTLVLASIIPWVVMFALAAFVLNLVRRPGPEQLHLREVDELREEMSLMRDFLKDVIERIRRLEEWAVQRELPPSTRSPALTSAEGEADPPIGEEPTA